MSPLIFRLCQGAVMTVPPMFANFRQTAIAALAVLLGVFVFYTSFNGPFESLVQRAIFVMTITALAVLMHPLFEGSRLRPLGVVIDVAIVGMVTVSGVYIIANYETIMTDLPWANGWDMVMGFGTLACVLELARRSSNWVFPLIVIAAVTYAFFGYLIPGQFGHRGFDAGYLTEIIFLSDRGLWGMLVNVASTTLAAFVLFGAILLHTGAGETFFDLSARLGGSRPGGAAKIATFASGFFGAINGSTVANVATTGNFTIPLMKRLNYPPAYAGAVEAIASTGGQLAPPIMGTAAFVMAELVGVNYWSIALAGVVPALLFYLGIYSTVHVIARRQGFRPVTAEDLPDWRGAMTFARLAPIVAALLGLGFGVFNGNSVELTACYGMIAMLVAVLVARISSGEDPRAVIGIILRALEAGGKGVVIVGILLVGAQVFVAMINLTGFGVAVTSAVLAIGQGQIWVIAGLGLPTSAAYVMVAAVFAPALIQQGIDPLVVHMFVLYYAALSVITPPVCLGVFVAATIAEAPWMKVAGETLRLGATAYALPMLFLAYPGMLGGGEAGDILRAILSGGVFALGVAHLLGGARLPWGGMSRLFWVLPIGLALMPPWSATLAAVVVFGILVIFSRKAIATAENIEMQAA